MPLYRSTGTTVHALKELLIFKNVSWLDGPEVNSSVVYQCCLGFKPCILQARGVGLCLRQHACFVWTVLQICCVQKLSQGWKPYLWLSLPA